MCRNIALKLALSVQINKQAKKNKQTKQNEKSRLEGIRMLS